MTRFVFRLQAVLGWRKLQLEAEEARLKQMLSSRALVVREIAMLDAQRASAELRVREWQAVPADELWALDHYREGVRRRAAALAGRLREWDEKIAAQRRAVMNAQRGYRLLERLHDRRRAEWEYLEAREREALSADAYLARWNARSAAGDQS